MRSLYILFLTAIFNPKVIPHKFGISNIGLSVFRVICIHGSLLINLSDK
jgi:hypothetical protein